MIDVRVTQNHRINFIDSKRKRVSISLFILRTTLNETTLKEN